MRLSTTVMACIALTWPVAAAGRTAPVDSLAVPEGAAVQAAASDSTAASAAAPTPTDYVAALTREAMAAHLGTPDAQSAQAEPPVTWKVRVKAVVVWIGPRARVLARFVSRPVVRDVLLPLLLLVPTGLVVWRLGTARGREAALDASNERLRAVRDLAAGGARVPDIARRTHMAQEGVSLAMHLANRRREVLR